MARPAPSPKSSRPRMAAAWAWCAAAARGMQRPVLQAGNAVQCVWRARLEEQLGTYRAGAAGPARRRHHGRAVPPGRPRHAGRTGPAPARARAAPPRLRGAAHRARRHRPGRRSGRPCWCAGKWACWTSWASASTCRKCAATGTRENLAYVSPRSGKAVSAAGGRTLPRQAVPPAGLPAGQRRGHRGRRHRRPEARRPISSSATCSSRAACACRSSRTGSSATLAERPH